MKFKCLTLILVSVMGIIQSHAQSQKVTDQILVDGPKLNVSGTRTYSFHPNDRGEKVYDGVYTITGKDVYTDLVDWPYKYSLTVSLKMSASHNNQGNLHGPISANWSHSQVYNNGKTNKLDLTFSGNLNNGLPHGAFNVDYSDEIKAYAKVNYNNGKLVGKYTIAGLTDDGVDIISGTLSSDGQLTGTWDINGIQQTFVNGVMVSKIDRDYTTPASLVDLAKKYAAGKITEQELEAKHISVKEVTLELGKAAASIIVGGKLIEWEDLGGFSFEEGYKYDPKYKYLEQTPYITDEGIEYLASLNYIEYVADGGEKWNYVYYTDDGKPYVSARWDGGKFARFVDIPIRGYNRIYMTLEQEHRLDSLAYRNHINDPRDYYSKMEWSTDKWWYYGIKGRLMQINNMRYCPIDGNVIWYDNGKNVNHDTDFFSKESFEKYLTEVGSLFAWYEKLISFVNSSETDPRIKSYAQEDIERLRPLVEKETAKVKNTVLSYFNTKIINKSFDQLDYSYRPVSRYDTKVLFPISKIDSIEFAPLDIVESVIEEYAGSYDGRQHLSRIDRAAYVITANVTKGTNKRNYTYKTSMLLDEYGEIICLFNIEQVRNDYDTIDELDVKIKDKATSIKEKSKDVYRAYVSYEQDYNSSLDYNDLKSVISKKEYLLKLLDSTMVFIDKRENVYKADEMILANYKSNPDFIKLYTSYCKSRDLTWSPVLPFVKIDNSITIQGQVSSFMEKYNKILEVDAEITSQCANKKVLLGAYLKYAKTRDLSWAPDWSLEKIDGYMSVQDRFMIFVKKTEEIQQYDDKIVSMTADKKDVKKAFLAHAKTRDLSWSPNWSQEKIDGYILVQKKCLEFNELRNCINNNTTKINSFKSSAPTIVKAYTTYVSTCDLTWKPDVDFAVANSLIEIQERCIAALNKQGVSDVDKKVKKQKMTNLLEILDVI